MDKFYPLDRTYPLFEQPGPGGDILPASEGTLIYFATYLARTVKHSTIKLYLAAVRNLHILSGHGDPFVGKLLLKKVLQGILRHQDQARILRQPVTPRVLLAIRPILRHWLGERDFTMIWVAFTLAFFAFFRCSEFTYQGTTLYSPSFDLSVSTVSFEPNLACPQRMSVFLQSPKTDTFCRGHINYCMFAFTALRGHGYASLFLTCASPGSPFLICDLSRENVH